MKCWQRAKCPDEAKGHTETGPPNPGPLHHPHQVAAHRRSEQPRDVDKPRAANICFDKLVRPPFLRAEAEINLLSTQERVSFFFFSFCSAFRRHRRRSRSSCVGLAQAALAPRKRNEPTNIEPASPVDSILIKMGVRAQKHRSALLARVRISKPSVGYNLWDLVPRAA